MYYENQYIITYLATVGGIDASQTTGIKLQSVAGVLTDRPGILIVDYADPLDETRCEWVSYTSIDVNQELVGAVRGVEKGSAKTHAQNAVIAFPHSKSNNNQFADIFHPAATTSTAENILLKETASAPTTPSAGYKKLYFDTDDKIYAVDDAGVAKAIATEQFASSVASVNSLINGNFDVWQRGTAFTAASSPVNNDDTYLADMWNLISDGNDAVDLSRDTDAPEGSKYSMLWDVETAKRFGIVQFIEAADVTKLKGKTVSLSFWVKSANISAIRAALLAWEGTADALTSDVVGTWAATPTWAANWVAENTPADLTVTSSWTQVKIEGIVLDNATINNLAIAIWLPNEETIGDTIRIAQVQLNIGATANSFVPQKFVDELLLCQRYCYVTPDAANGSYGLIGTAFTQNTTQAVVVTPAPVRMRTYPTLSLIGAANTFRLDNAVDFSVAATSIAIDTYATTTDYLGLAVAVASGLTAKQPMNLQRNNNTTSKIIFSADL